nr:hypothetical protein [Brevundimonas diminuta]
MEFRPLTRNGDAKPRLAAKSSSATLSVPPHCAERASLAAGPVSLGIAEERNKVFLQVLADPKGEYRLAQRGSNLVLTTPTLLPRAPTPKHRAGIEVDVHSQGQGLVIEFPKDWKLASD